MPYQTNISARWTKGLVPSLLAVAIGFMTVQAPVMASEVTMAVPAEPESLTPRNGCSYASQFVTDNVYERLMRRGDDGALEGWLAESAERVDDLTWRFKLREGVSFSNGEPLNAQSVVASVNYYVDPAITSRCLGDFVNLASAEAVDEYTVDVKTSQPDGIFNIAFGLRFFVMPQGWISETDDLGTATTAIGTGPYVLTEWNKGQRLVLEANPNYWGEAPSVERVVLLPRTEGAVRAAMVQAGEADIAINLTPEQAANLPQQLGEETTESILVRLNTKHPVLSDVRVRKAITLSLDTPLLVEALYPGVASVLQGQVARPSALGFNPDLAPYPHDLDEAKRLVEEAGATGKELTFSIRSDLLSNVSELAEAMQAMIEETGLVINLEMLEAAPWRDALYARKEGQQRTDMLISGASNHQFDSSRLINNYFGVGNFSHSDNEDFAAKSVVAAGLSGEERASAYRALWAEAHDQYWIVPVFGVDYLHGARESVAWEPRDDGFIYFNEIGLK